MERFVEEANYTKDKKKSYLNVHKVDQMNGLEPYRLIIKKQLSLINKKQTKLQLLCDQRKPYIGEK